MDGRKTGRSSMGSNLLLGLAAFIWGVAFVAQSVGMEYVKAFTFNGCRFLIGGAVLLPLIWVMRGKKGKAAGGAGGGTANGMGEGGPGGAAGRKRSGRTGIVGGICCGAVLFVASSFQQLGVAETTVGKAGFITALYIVMVPLLGIFLGKRIPWSVWLSVALATAGMYLLCMTEGLKVSRGDLYVFLCAICFSIHILVIDYVSPRADGVVVSCVQFFTAGILSAIAAVIFEAPRISSIRAAWAPILYAGVISCGVGYTLQVVAQKNTDPVLASLILSLESVFSLLAGWVILGQKLSFKELGGCALVFAAIILAQLPVRSFMPQPQDKEKCP